MHTHWHCSVPWRHQVTTIISEVFPDHVLNMEFPYHPWYQAVLVSDLTITPVPHARPGEGGEDRKWDKAINLQSIPLVMYFLQQDSTS